MKIKMKNLLSLTTTVTALLLLTVNTVSWAQSVSLTPEQQNETVLLPVNGIKYFTTKVLPYGANGVIGSLTLVNIKDFAFTHLGVSHRVSYQMNFISPVEWQIKGGGEDFPNYNNVQLKMIKNENDSLGQKFVELVQSKSVPGLTNLNIKATFTNNEVKELIVFWTQTSVSGQEQRTATHYFFPRSVK